MRLLNRFSMILIRMDRFYRDLPKTPLASALVITQNFNFHLKSLFQYLYEVKSYSMSIPAKVGYKILIWCMEKA